MIENEDHLSSKVARLQKETSPIPRQGERWWALIITWASVVVTICVAASVTLRIIDLHT